MVLQRINITLSNTRFRETLSNSLVQLSPPTRIKNNSPPFTGFEKLVLATVERMWSPRSPSGAPVQLEHTKPHLEHSTATRRLPAGVRRRRLQNLQDLLDLYGGVISCVGTTSTSSGAPARPGASNLTSVLPPPPRRTDGALPPHECSPASALVGAPGEKSPDSSKNSKKEEPPAWWKTVGRGGKRSQHLRGRTIGFPRSWLDAETAEAVGDHDDAGNGKAGADHVGDDHVGAGGAAARPSGAGGAAPSRSPSPLDGAPREHREDSDCEIHPAKSAKAEGGEKLFPLGEKGDVGRKGPFCSKSPRLSRRRSRFCPSTETAGCPPTATGVSVDALPRRADGPTKRPAAALPEAWVGAGAATTADRRQSSTSSSSSPRPRSGRGGPAAEKTLNPKNVFDSTRSASTGREYEVLARPKNVALRPPRNPGRDYEVLKRPKNPSRLRGKIFVLPEPSQALRGGGEKFCPGHPKSKTEETDERAGQSSWKGRIVPATGKDASSLSPSSRNRVKNWTPSPRPSQEPRRSPPRARRNSRSSPSRLRQRERSQNKNRSPSSSHSSGPRRKKIKRTRSGALRGRRERRHGGVLEHRTFSQRREEHRTFSQRREEHRTFSQRREEQALRRRPRAGQKRSSSRRGRVVRGLSSKRSRSRNVRSRGGLSAGAVTGRSAGELSISGLLGKPSSDLLDFRSAPPPQEPAQPPAEEEQDIRVRHKILAKSSRAGGVLDQLHNIEGRGDSCSRHSLGSPPPPRRSSGHHEDHEEQLSQRSRSLSLSSSLERERQQGQRGILSDGGQRILSDEDEMLNEDFVDEEEVRVLLLFVRRGGHFYCGRFFWRNPAERLWEDSVVVVLDGGGISMDEDNPGES